MASVLDQIILQAMQPSGSAGQGYGLSKTELELLKIEARQKGGSKLTHRERVAQSTVPVLLRSAAAMEEKEASDLMRYEAQLEVESEKNYDALTLPPDLVGSLERFASKYRGSDFQGNAGNEIQHLIRQPSSLLLKYERNKDYPAKELALKRELYRMVLEKPGYALDHPVVEQLRTQWFEGTGPDEFIQQQTKFPIYSVEQRRQMVAERKSQGMAQKYWDQAQSLMEFTDPAKETGAPSQLSEYQQRQRLEAQAGVPAQKYYAKPFAPTGFRDYSPKMARYARQIEEIKERSERDSARIGARQARRAERTNILSSFMGRSVPSYEEQEAAFEELVPSEAEALQEAEDLSQVQFGRLQPEQITIGQAADELTEEEQFEFGKVDLKDIAVEEAEDVDPVVPLAAPAPPPAAAAPAELTGKERRQARRTERQAERGITVGKPDTMDKYGEHKHDESARRAATRTNLSPRFKRAASEILDVHYKDHDAGKGHEDVAVPHPTDRRGRRYSGWEALSPLRLEEQAAHAQRMRGIPGAKERRRVAKRWEDYQEAVEAQAGTAAEPPLSPAGQVKTLPAPAPPPVGETTATEPLPTDGDEVTFRDPGFFSVEDAIAGRVKAAADVGPEQAFYMDPVAALEVPAAPEPPPPPTAPPQAPVGPLAAGEPPLPAGSMPELSDEVVAGLEGVIPGIGMMSQRDQRQQVLGLEQKRLKANWAKNYYDSKAVASGISVAKLGPVAGQLQQQINAELESFNKHSGNMKAAGHWKSRKTLGRHAAQYARDVETMKVVAYQEAKEKHDQKIEGLQSQIEGSVQQLENEKANQARYQAQFSKAEQALQGLSPTASKDLKLKAGSTLQQAMEWARRDPAAELMEIDEPEPRPEFQSAVGQMTMEDVEPEPDDWDLSVPEPEPEPGEPGPRAVGGVGGTVLDEAGAFDSPDKYIPHYEKHYDGSVGKLPQDMKDYLFGVEKKHGLPPGLLQANAWIESGFDRKAISYNKKGDPVAYGMFQIVPGTADHLGIKNQSDPKVHQNWKIQADASARYLKEMYLKFKGHAESERDGWRLALAAYNTGPANLTVALQNPGAEFKTKNRDDRGLHPETRRHVGKYDAAMEVIQNNQELAPTWELQNQQGTDDLLGAFDMEKRGEQTMLG